MPRRFVIVLSIEVGQQQCVWKKPSNSNKEYNNNESKEECSAHDDT